MLLMPWGVLLKGKANTCCRALPRNDVPGAAHLFLLSGLYDPALGPTDFGVTCSTCGLTYPDCPGHLGHIELSVPVYHPLLLSQLFKILRLKCFFCHKYALSSP